MCVRISPPLRCALIVYIVSLCVEKLFAHQPSASFHVDSHLAQWHTAIWDSFIFSPRAHHSTQKVMRGAAGKQKTLAWRRCALTKYTAFRVVFTQSRKSYWKLIFIFCFGVCLACDLLTVADYQRAAFYYPHAARSTRFSLLCQSQHSPHCSAFLGLPARSLVTILIHHRH